MSLPDSIEESKLLFEAFPTQIGYLNTGKRPRKEVKIITNLPLMKNHGNSASLEDFVLDLPELKDLKELLLLIVQDFAENALDIDCKLGMTQSWMNVSKPGESHHPHSHANSLISAVWFPVGEGPLEPIWFYNPRTTQIEVTRKEQLQMANTSVINYIPKRNDIIVFPSYLRHSVSPNQNSYDRYSVSFNTWSTEGMGNRNARNFIPPNNFSINKDCCSSNKCKSRKGKKKTGFGT
jgi:uncharacterized protein (TIGR02466 family)